MRIINTSDGGKALGNGMISPGHWEQLCNIVHCNKQRPASIVYDLRPDRAVLVQWGLMAGRLKPEPSSFLGCDNYLHEGTKQGDSVKGQSH